MAECQEESKEENVSDEDKRKSCDSCSFRSVENHADTYCPICGEYLCASCVEIHRSFKATRTHELVLIVESAGDATRMKAPETNVMICDTHRSETLAEFCDTHEKVICRLCKMARHRHCDTVALSKVAENGKKSFTTVLEDMEALASEFEKIECARLNDRRHIREMSSDLRVEVEKVKDEIITWAEKLTKNALQEIGKTEVGLLSNVDSHIEVAKEMKSLLTTDKTSFEKLGNVSLLESFVFMTKSKQQIQEGTDLKLEIQNEMKPLILNFYKSDELSKFIANVSAIGIFKIEDARSIDFRKISMMTKKRDIGVDSCWVTGCIFMPNGQLVICDETNHTVKVLTSEFKLRNELKLDSRVWDIAILSTDEVIVTKPRSKCLDVLNVSGPVRKVKSIPIGEECWGVEIKKDRIYVSCHFQKGKGGNIKVLTLDGVCLNTFWIDTGNPYYLAVNDGEGRIIVCTDTTSKVLCIDMEGNTIYTYSGTEMQYSLGFLLDSCDNFMVCGRQSNNVHVVKKDGTKHKILLSSDDGLSEPYCLAYRSTDKTLVVGQRGTKSLTAFSIKI